MPPSRDSRYGPVGPSLLPDRASASRSLSGRDDVPSKNRGQSRLRQLVGTSGVCKQIPRLAVQGRLGLASTASPSESRSPPHLRDSALRRLHRNNPRLSTHATRVLRERLLGVPVSRSLASSQVLVSRSPREAEPHDPEATTSTENPAPLLCRGLAPSISAALHRRTALLRPRRERGPSLLAERRAAI